MWSKLLLTDHSRSTLLVRMMVGTIFLSEGIQKFLFPAALGTGRFERLGFPDPGFFAGFVGTFEILCGLLVLLGLLTRFAAIPLIIIMLVSITTTKIPILLDKGLWSMLHEGRTDWAMLLGALFLFSKGGGAFSLDISISLFKRRH